LRPQWQRHPRDGIQKLVIGNMNRFVDVYAADGTQLAQLGDDQGENRITAVPAVAIFHPSQDWIAAGTASGKLCLWQQQSREPGLEV
jgi:WD repeat-containing protein 76